MFEVSQVLSAFSGLIGWRQNQNPNGVQLDGITTSSSGLWYNKQHPFLTIDNLHSIAPDFSDWYSAWSVATTYAINEVVSYGGKYYKSNAGSNTGNIPTGGSWTEYFPFSVWLETITGDFLIDVINEWIELKSSLKTANNLLSSDTLFNHTGSKAQITKTGSRVGIIISPYKSESLKMRIREIAIQLSQNQSLTLYLYKVGTETAIETQVISYTGAGSEQWQVVDWELDGDGIYYIMYDEDDLTGNAINGVEGGIHGRSSAGIGLLPFHSFIQYSPVQTLQPLTPITDIDNFSYSYDMNYGLNLKFDIRCDYTQFIIDQKDLFKNMIAKGVTIRFLKELLFNASSNINRKSSNINIQRIDLIYELDGDPASPKSQGLEHKYKLAMDAVKFDVSGIDKLCLPCSKRSVRYRSVV